MSKEFIVFPRYHQRENLITNNILVFLSYIKNLSPALFYELLNEITKQLESEFSDIEFTNQYRAHNQESIPDASIFQDSFRILIETKPSANELTTDQLVRHCSKFENESIMLLLSLSRDRVSEANYNNIRNEVRKTNPNIFYYHLTFSELFTRVLERIKDHEEELQLILDDFVEYLRDENLIDNTLMRAVNVTTSLEDNIDLSLYYCPSKRGYSFTDYLGLCNLSSIKHIGLVRKMFNLVKVENGNLEIEWITSIDNDFTLSVDEQNRVLEAITRAQNYSGVWDVSFNHTFYLVDRFCETDYRRVHQNAFQKSKIFNLETVLEVQNARQFNCYEIANMLNGREW